jgi:phospholipase C
MRGACSFGAAAIVALGLGCGGSDGDAASQEDPSQKGDGGASNDGGGFGDGGAPGDGGGSGDGSGGDGAVGTSNIEHVVIIIQENHTFDAYFGRYCTAPAGSNPTCNTGPSCCERAPDKDPSGASPVTLDDSENAGYDPNHTQACELSEMNSGAMDRYVTGASCSNAKNFAIADQAVAQYHTYASSYAIADRYFQPLVGQSSSNDMYFAVAKFVFLDNSYQPNTNGHGCAVPPTATIEYSGQTTIADVLVAGGKTFAFYAEGYQAMINALLCPAPPSDCPAHIPTGPCDYQPSDNPFQYYTQFADNRTYQKDFDQFSQDIGASKLPNVSFIKPLQYKNEHPGYGTTISAGVTFVKGVVDAIAASSYANNTLVLVTWDEGGGFFDHVKPPPDSTVDQKPYGTRVPVLAIGRFARKNYVSHVNLEHSSIVRFIEYNFLGGKTGQLGARDAVVNNIGSLLDPFETGIVIPE